MPVTIQELYDVHRFKDPLNIPPTKHLKPNKPPHKVNLKAATVKLHSELPETAVWTYEGTFPGPTFEVQSGDEISVEWVNKIQGNLPLIAVTAPDNTQNQAGSNGRTPVAGIDQLPAWTVVHLHGGRTAADSDGWTENALLYGQSDLFKYSNETRAAMLWYHDHAMHVTRLNVFAGLAGLWFIRDDDEEKLKLPSGKREIPLLIQDRNLETNADGTLTGKLLHKVEDGVMEFFGPLNLVNGVVWPHHDVDARQYRVRVLNGSNARTYRLCLLDENKNVVNDAVKQIGTDGGLLGEVCDIPAAGLILAPAERADLIVDFRAFRGKHLRLTNTAAAPFNNDPLPTTAVLGEPIEDVSGEDSLRLKFPDVMEFRVADKKVKDNFALPLKLSSFVRLTHDDLPHEHEHRLIALVEQDLPSDPTPMLTLRELFPIAANEAVPGESLITIVNDKGESVDYRTVASEFEDAVNFFAAYQSTEVWKILNLTEDTHPFHVHLVQFQAMTRHRYDIDGFDPDTGGTKPNQPIIFDRPAAFDQNETGWKDTIRINPKELVSIAMKFDGFTGRYMYHCHILEHEDHDMMRPFVVQPAEIMAMMHHKNHEHH